MQPKWMKEMQKQQQQQREKMMAYAWIQQQKTKRQQLPLLKQKYGDCNKCLYSYKCSTFAELKQLRLENKSLRANIKVKKNMHTKT